MWNYDIIISRGAAGPQPLQTQNGNLKNTDSVDITISNVLRDFPFSRNQPLKSADDRYIRILKNKLIKFKKTGLSHGTCSYICMYINAVTGSVMLCLQRGFCNIIFKTKHKLHIASGSAPPPPPVKISGRAPGGHFVKTFRNCALLTQIPASSAVYWSALC
jgi:hypothetical protein